MRAYQTDRGNTLYAVDANEAWRYTPSSDRLAAANIRGDHTLYLGGGYSEGDALRHLSKLDRDIGQTGKINPFGWGKVEVKDDANYLTVAAADRHFLTADGENRYGVTTLPRGSIYDDRNLNAALRAQNIPKGDGTKTVPLLVGIDKAIKDEWWSIGKVKNEWLPQALASDKLTAEQKANLQKSVSSDIENWSPTGDVIDAALVVGGAGAIGKGLSMSGKVGSKLIAPLAKEYKAIERGYDGFIKNHELTGKVLSASKRGAKAAATGAVGLGTVGIVYDQTPNENLITYSNLGGQPLEDAYKQQKYTGFDDSTGEPTGYRSDASPSRIGSLLVIGGAESPQMIEKGYRGVASFGGDILTKGSGYAANQLLQRGSKFAAKLGEQLTRDPLGTTAEMIGLTGGAAGLAKVG